MTKDEAFALWCERVGLDPALPESLQEYERQQQSDLEDHLSNQQRARDDEKS